jgi:hypothetical protein
MKDGDDVPYVRASASAGFKSRRGSPDPGGAASRRATHGAAGAPGGAGGATPRVALLLLLLLGLVGGRLVYVELGLRPRAPAAVALRPLGARGGAAGAAAPQHADALAAAGGANATAALPQLARASPAATAAAADPQEGAAAGAVAAATKLIRGAGRDAAPAAPRPLKYPLWWHAPFKSGTGYGSGAQSGPPAACFLGRAPASALHVVRRARCIASPG